MSNLRTSVLYIIFIVTFCSCANRKTQSLDWMQQEIVALEKLLEGGHLGISIYDNDNNEAVVSYNDTKYFTPASNIKLFTCYAAMKYLGDSIPSLRYTEIDKKHGLAIIPTGDPTILHPDFECQPAFSFLKKYKGETIAVNTSHWQTTALGKGWSWEDFEQEFMTERSVMPLYANNVWFTLKNALHLNNANAHSVVLGDRELLDVVPSFFKNSVSSSGVDNSKVEPSYQRDNKFTISRSLYKNEFLINESSSSFKSSHLPFLTQHLTEKLLFDTLKKEIVSFQLQGDWQKIRKDSFSIAVGDYTVKVAPFSTIYSYRTDSLLQLMMHKSDNFLAEQTLLMASNELLGYMNEEKLIDSILKSDFLTMPQKPVWVDGSGLSRYNLATPRSFVWLLNKLKNEFSLQRLKNILPTGGEGTLLHYYTNDSGFVFAKTGTLGGQVAISGFLTTEKNRLFTFSVLVSNHNTSTSEVRRGVEKYLQQIRKMF